MLKKCLATSVIIAAFVAVTGAQNTPSSSGQQQNATPQTPTQQPTPTPNPAVTPAPPAPPPSTPAARTTSTPSAQAASASTTLTGCVYREQDVPGRKPNVAERAGILEDYILATTSDAVRATPGTPDAVTGTAGSTAMYKLEKIDDNKLKSLVGKRVEVMGRIDADPSDSVSGTPTPNRNPGPDRIDLPEFEVTSIKEVGGSCPAMPAR